MASAGFPGISSMPMPGFAGFAVSDMLSGKTHAIRTTSTARGCWRRSSYGAEVFAATALARAADLASMLAPRSVSAESCAAVAPAA